MGILCNASPSKPFVKISEGCGFEIRVIIEELWEDKAVVGAGFGLAGHGAIIKVCSGNCNGVAVAVWKIAFEAVINFAGDEVITGVGDIIEFTMDGVVEVWQATEETFGASGISFFRTVEVLTFLGLTVAELVPGAAFV